MKTKLFLLFFAPFFIINIQYGQTIVYEVYPNNTSGKHTIESALKEVEKLNTEGNYPSEGIEIVLHKGEYKVSSVLKLTAKHNGTAAAPLKITTNSKGDAVLFGGEYISHEWFNKLSDTKIINTLTNKAAAESILVANLKANGITEYGAISRHGWMLEPPDRVAPVGLVVGGERMELARWPNKDEALPYLDELASKEGLKGMVSYKDIIDVGPKKPKTGKWYEDSVFMGTGGTFSVEFDRMKNWHNIGDVWLDGCLGTTWEWTYNKIESANLADKTITLSYGELNGIGGNLERVSHFYFENILEELDIPGEYYIDREQGLLYLYPPENFESKTIFLSSLSSNVFEISNTNHIILENLVIDAGRKNGIYINRANNIKVQNCEIRNVSMGGVYVNGKNNLISNCHIHNVGSFGITLMGGNKKTLSPGNNIAEYCQIHSIAWDQKSQMPGVFLNRGVGNHARHNEIWDTPHFAIRMSYTNDCSMEFNTIHDLPTYHMFDGGAVYVYTGPKNPENRGNYIKNNFLYNVPTNGIYADNYAMGVFIEKNYFYNVSYLDGEWGFGPIMLNTGGQNRINDNVFIDCKIPVLWGKGGYYNAYKRNPDIQQSWNNAVEKWGNGKIENTVYNKYETFKEFLSLSPENDFEAYKWPESYANRNLFVNINVPLSLKANKPNGYKNEKGKVVVNESWATDSDPGFKNFENLNFQLNANSAVFSRIPGFSPGEFIFNTKVNSDSTKQTNLDNGFNIFPNPASNYLFINNPISESTVAIYNLNGNKQCEHQVKKGINAIDVSKLNKGVYICRKVSPLMQSGTLFITN